jgi:hypothetical protein
MIPGCKTGDFFVYYTMTEFVEQGQVSVTGTILCTGTTGLALTKVVNLRFYNPLGYVLRLERYNALSSTTEVIYELGLSPGDAVTDSLAYALNQGDRLIAYSDILGTTYYVYGIDYASS